MPLVINSLGGGDTHTHTYIHMHMHTLAPTHTHMHACMHPHPPTHTPTLRTKAILKKARHAWLKIQIPAISIYKRKRKIVWQCKTKLQWSNYDDSRDDASWVIAIAAIRLSYVLSHTSMCMGCHIRVCICATHTHMGKILVKDSASVIKVGMGILHL